MDVSILAQRDRLPLLRLPFPNLERMLQEIFSTFERAVKHYYSLPLEARQALALAEPYKKEVDLGFVDKSLEKGHDNKLYFHYRPEIRERLCDEVWSELFGKCDVLYHLSLKQCFDVVSEIECLKPSLKGLGDMLQDHWGHRMRLLWYKNGSGTLAQRHCDRSFLTNHLGETHDGLMVQCQGVYLPVEIYPNQSCFFSGEKAPLATAGWIPDAVEHRVVRERATVESRMAAVFFLHGPWKLPHTEH